MTTFSGLTDADLDIAMADTEKALRLAKELLALPRDKPTEGLKLVAEVTPAMIKKLEQDLDEMRREIEARK